MRVWSVITALSILVVLVTCNHYRYMNTFSVTKDNRYEYQEFMVWTVIPAYPSYQRQVTGQQLLHHHLMIIQASNEMGHQHALIQMILRLWQQQQWAYRTLVLNFNRFSCHTPMCLIHLSFVECCSQRESSMPYNRLPDTWSEWGVCWVPFKENCIWQQEETTSEALEGF